MILQLGVSGNQILGIALLVGLALMLAILTKVPLLKGFICFCLVVAPFLFQANLIDFWIIPLLIISIIIIDLITLLNKRGMSSR